MNFSGVNCVCINEVRTDNVLMLLIMYLFFKKWVLLIFHLLFNFISKSLTSNQLRWLPQTPGSGTAIFSSAFTKHGESFKASKSAVLKRIHKTSSSYMEAAFAVNGALIVNISFVVILLGAAEKYVNFYGFCEAIWNYITNIGPNNCRIDIICDNYSDKNLLKEKTRSSQPTGFW